MWKSYPFFIILIAMFHKFAYPNHLALVTGASSGIGSALAKELILQGWTVIGIGRSQERLEILQKELGKEHFSFSVCDLANKEAVASFSKELVNQGKCPSLFFLNAGLCGAPALEKPDRFILSKHEEIMAVNYFGVLSWIQFWEEPCKANGGANFVVTSSVNALFAPPLGGAYAASKAAIAKTFESLALTYFHTNLHFSVIYPGPVATPGFTGSIPFTWSAEKMAKYMVKKALKGCTHSEPSLFYSTLSRICHILPYRWIAPLFKTWPRRELTNKNS